MSVEQLRRLRVVAAIGVVALAVYVTIGHAAHPTAFMDQGKTMHGAAICLVLVALAVAVIVPRLRGDRPRSVARPPQLLGLVVDKSPSASAAAHASPAWLQRFLN